MCLGQWCDDVFGALGVILAQKCLDRVELVSDVFELFIEGFPMVSEPVLDGFEQIPWEVILVAFGIAVCCDVFEPVT